MSLIWKIDLYNKLADEEVECIACKSAGKEKFTIKCKNWNTTNLKTHLTKHPKYKDKFNALLEKESSKDGGPKQESMETFTGKYV
jgi:hypothetical protein